MREQELINQIYAYQKAHSSNGCEISLEKSFVLLQQLQDLKGFECFLDTLDYYEDIVFGGK